MNTHTHLIFFKSQDKTFEIETADFDSAADKWLIKFHGSQQIYKCNPGSVQVYDTPELLDLSEYHFKRGNKPFYNVKEVIKFGDYYRFCFLNGKETVLHAAEFQMERTCLSGVKEKNSMGYFRALSKEVSLKSDDGESLLSRQFEKIEFVEDKVVLASYLNQQKYPLKAYEEGPLIFPFGCNESQKKALEKALHNQLTVIEGPPGTGKTQTILNIIANILVQNKKVAVVSNNNAATANVYEKLEKNNLGYLCACLGNSENKQQFLEGQALHQFDAPDMTAEMWKETLTAADTAQKKLSKNLSLRNRLAQMETEYNSIKLEQQHFQNYVRETFGYDRKIDITLKLSSTQVLAVKTSLEEYAEKYGRTELKWPRKLWLYIGHRIRDRKFLNSSLDEILTEFERQYYDLKLQEITEQQEEIQKTLTGFHYEEKKREMEELSMVVLKERLAQYFKGYEEHFFNAEDLWKNADAVLGRYPVILSTTHSMRSSLPGVIYDYVIVDEASQVDLLTGVLAMSCARNLVVVGDEKQLPNVITGRDLEKAAAIDARFEVPEELRYGSHSLLTSVKERFAEAPQVILREHYRCHPRIIQFCNKKFYKDQLIVMTTDNQEKDVLKVNKTVAGNHARGKVNQRQIDEIRMVVLPELEAENICPGDIGIISPYRDQADAMMAEIDGHLAIDTVHKFQGREKEAIILATVDNEITEFTDSPNLLNVAVSRAVSKLRLVISENEKNENTNIGDLVKYISYEKGEIISGKVYSVFDLLYKANREARELCLKGKKRISEMDSENLFYYFLQEFLSDNGMTDLEIATHVPLRRIIKNPDVFEEPERSFILNSWSHVDFLLHRKVNRQPVLAIEVDGARYHKKGSMQKEVRDKCKDAVFETCGLPLLRLATTGSREDEKLKSALDNALSRLR